MDERIHRNEESKEYKNTTYGGLKELFEHTMESDETFIDFSNAPYLYVHTNRQTPMYINQTPVFLSDEVFTPKQYRSLGIQMFDIKSMKETEEGLTLEKQVVRIHKSKGYLG